MKPLALICALSSVVAILSLGGHAQVSQEKKTLEQRVEELEKALAETRGQLTGLTEAFEKETATIDALRSYAAKQAEAANAMAATLDRSESEGFTAGINYSSRVTLLAGWRKQLGEMQNGVPGGPVRPADESVPPAGRGERKRR